MDEKRAEDCCAVWASLRLWLDCYVPKVRTGWLRETSTDVIYKTTRAEEEEGLAETVESRKEGALSEAMKMAEAALAEKKSPRPFAKSVSRITAP